MSNIKRWLLWFDAVSKPIIYEETFEKCSILFKIKAGENFNHPSTICQTYGAGIH
jgi:hypothetical protein